MSRAASAPAQAAPIDATQFLRPHLLKLAAYTPSEPFEILSAKYGRAPQDIIKLDANENPYGPPPEVLNALATMPFPHIYPDPETRALRKALAEMNDCPMENILVSDPLRAGPEAPQRWRPGCCGPQAIASGRSIAAQGSHRPRPARRSAAAAARRQQLQLLSQAAEH